MLEAAGTSDRRSIPMSLYMVAHEEMQVLPPAPVMQPLAGPCCFKSSSGTLCPEAVQPIVEAIFIDEGNR